jgi:hypothetical protein
MKKHFLAGALLVATLGAAPAAHAQTPLNPVQPWGSWAILTAQLPGSAEHRWGGYVELQGRSNALARQFFYYELKGGASFDIDPNFTVLVGGGRYSTSDYRALEDGPLNTEKRLWEQLVLTQYSKRLKLEHRYRIEQRWFSFRDDSTAFRQRIRYRLNGFFPLNKKTITTGTLFLSAYDEIFLNPSGPVFERNRVYGQLQLHHPPGPVCAAEHGRQKQHRAGPHLQVFAPRRAAGPGAPALAAGLIRALLRPPLVRRPRGTATEPPTLSFTFGAAYAEAPLRAHFAAAFRCAPFLIHLVKKTT